MSDRELLERHPWNVDFAWQPCRGPFRRLSTEQAEQFDSLGFVVIEDAVDASTLEVVIREVDRFERELEAFLRTQTDDRAFIAEADAITFTTHLVARSAVIRALAVTDVFVDLAADLIGPDVNMYWDQAVYKKPEKPRRFPWHQDNGYTFIEPQQYLTCWVALTDANEHNGCPWIAPGVHRAGTLAHTYVDPLGFECFAEPPAAAVPAPVRGRKRARVLVAHTAHDRTEPDRRRAQGVHPPVRTGRSPGAARRSALARPARTRACDDPERQFPILRSGLRVAT